MAFRCFECRYDVATWCETMPENCEGCPRLNNDGKCECLVVDTEACPDFVPKEDANEYAH